MLKNSRFISHPAAVAAVLAGLSGCVAGPTLPSWTDHGARERIESFVAEVTDSGGAGFVPASERVAVFDNDGTLWAEQPAYFQLLFAIDRVVELAPRHPRWQTEQPFRAVLDGDMEAVAASGHAGLAKLIAASHAGMTSEEFSDAVRSWLETARHPETGRPYTEMVYRPMLELLAYLRSHGFETYIVSGGGIEFMRVFSEEVYGIPPENVIGSSIRTEYVVGDRGPAIQRLPELDFIDDKAGKPVAINRFIGRRPIAAFGNSDGDYQMLEWTDAGDGPRLCVIVRHTDEVREYLYDRDSSIGRLDEALDAADERDWLVIDMAADWTTVFGGK